MHFILNLLKYYLIKGLLDRVTFLDKRIKMASLCNYEQSHIFGLRLLSFLQTDLDVLLLLESQYAYSSLLLNLQKANRPLKAKYDAKRRTVPLDELQTVEEIQASV